MLDDARIERLQDLFERAVELPDARRAEFLERLSGDDSALRGELRSLLEAHAVPGDFFDDLTDNLVSPAFTAVMDAARQARASVLLPRLEAALRDTYRVVEEIGGGMSRVFLAEEIRLGRRVVIKVLPPELSESGSAERFQREIQLAAQLQHPHIVPVLTSGTADSLPYYTMPFVAGESLRDRLRREKGLPIADARGVWHDMLEAVEHAHANGVVHRDIKPDNVLLSGRNAMVSDFGIARAIEVAGDVGDPAPGLTIGTPAYMAPEQIRADADVDHRVDLYGAGLVMYEMLEGRLPFSGDTNREIVLARLTREPSSIQRPDCPPGLAVLVMRCLAPTAAGRPASADAVLAELDAIPSSGAPTHAKPPIPGHRVVVYGVAAMAIAAALFGAGYLLGRDQRPAALDVHRREARGVLGEQGLQQLFHRPQLVIHRNPRVDRDVAGPPLDI